MVHRGNKGTHQTLRAADLQKAGERSKGTHGGELKVTVRCTINKSNSKVQLDNTKKRQGMKWK